ncbi:hypothetical protein CEXT_723661 [Caerostris extrusa]|uniref:Uncharacterized protein n=1 Tax=Caerostris extrusa TaxID=172846 RepID=A0AAV4M4S8_CAEEX|nr:hypothetical protein CEXT_723661 [Caerostris extrusa]
MRGTNSAPSPSYLRRQKKCAWETDADFTSLVATAIDFSQQTDTLQHPLKGNGQHLHEGTNSAPSLPTSRGKEVSIPFLPPEAKKCAWETDADFTSLVATAIDFSQQTDTLQHPLKGTANICMRGQIQLHPLPTSRGKEQQQSISHPTNRHSATSFKGNGQHLHANSAPSPSYLQRQKKCAWETDADFYISGSNSNFLATNRHSATSFKGNGQHLHEGTNSAPIPSYLQRQKCAWETDADFYISGSNSNRFLTTNRHSATSFKKGTANICMRGQIQLHPLPTSEAKKCAWETDADFTSLVATAIDFSQQTDTLQHPLKRERRICMRGQIQLHPLPTSRGKRSVHGKPTLILHLW